MTAIPEEAFADILKELQRQPLQINKYRNKCGVGRSQCFGVVNRRCLPADYSRQCWMRPYLYKLLLEFGEKYVPFSFTSITVNDNYKAGKHRDKGNQGNSLLVAFGDYTGGELEILEGGLKGTHDIRHNAVITDFSKVYHQVKEFAGERYSLVYYTIKTPTPLPPASVVLDNGKYYFKRGDEIITNGLPHPLKGRLKIVQQDITISFT